MSPRVRLRSVVARLEAALAGHIAASTDEERDLESLAATLSTFADEPVPPPQRTAEARARMLAAVAEAAAQRRLGGRSLARGTTLAAATIAGVGMLVASAASPGSPVDRLRDSISGLPAAITGNAGPLAAVPVAGQGPRVGTPAPSATSTPPPGETSALVPASPARGERPGAASPPPRAPTPPPARDTPPAAPAPTRDDPGSASDRPSDAVDLASRPSPTPTPARSALAPADAATPTATRSPGDASVLDVDSSNVAPPPTPTPTPVPTRTPTTNHTTDASASDLNAPPTATPTATSTPAPDETEKLAPDASSDDGGR